jgi:hypothetical protein
MAPRAAGVVAKLRLAVQERQAAESKAVLLADRERAEMSERFRESHTGDGRRRAPAPYLALLRLRVYRNTVDRNAEVARCIAVNPFSSPQ